MSDFLFEIGLEEIPARMIAGAQAELLKRVVALLGQERLLGQAGEEARGCSTPRRLAIFVPGVLDRQPDLTEELLGPATKIAYKDGVPGPAAVAFAKKSGVAVEELRVVSTAKGEYIAATSTRAGRSAAEVLAVELPKELDRIYWAKNMYWRAGKPEKFVRPVRWLVALLGEAVVPVSFGGYEAGRQTYGHRVLFGPEPIELATPGDYIAKLTEASVMADVELRRHTIRKALDHVCRTVPDTRWREDHALVDKMTHLTEWPSVIAGDFDPAYLTLPEEVLVTVMRDHQNYFAVEDKQGKLAPYFLAVLNTVADEAGQAVIRHGNARVLRARFNDARFFWDFDQRVPLADRRKLLENITFHKDAGNYSVKARRTGQTAAAYGLALRERNFAIEYGSLFRACELAKTDLTTELVKEFTELQGIIGGLYARAQGEPETVAIAIYDQYRPVAMTDSIPSTPEGQVLSLADRSDTLVEMFKVGLQPTGSKDPFALRRAANGIVKILAESSIPLTVSEVVWPGGEDVHAFVLERLEFYLREIKGFAYDTIKAVMKVDSERVRDVIARAEAVTQARRSSDFEAVSAAFKRMSNILTQAADKGSQPAAVVEPALLTPGAESTLAMDASRLAKTVEDLRESGAYTAALEAMATLRPAVDTFFEAVMVMDPDERIRANRLALLRDILAGFGGIADFSEIVTAG